MAMLGAALCFGFVESASGQSPASEEAPADAQPAIEAAIDSAAEEIVDASGPQADAPSGPELRGADLWARNLEELIAGLEALERQPTDADAFYAALMPVLQARRLELREALKWARSPEALIPITPNEAEPGAMPDEPAAVVEELSTTKEAGSDASADSSAVETIGGAGMEDPGAAPPVAEEGIDVAGSKLSDEVQTLSALHETVVALYATRIVLLNYVTPELRAKVTGVGLTGVRELHGEILQIILSAHYKALSIPARATAWPAMVKEAPLPMVFGIGKLIVALIIFRWWRRWVPGALMGLRDRLLAARRAGGETFALPGLSGTWSACGIPSSGWFFCGPF